jgi:Right handed beta helix region
MTLVRCLGAVVVLVGLGLGCMSDASAQASRTWISGVGDDANPCSRTAPCKTFAGAISKTAALGEIDCLDPGGFGAVTITKPITLDCAGGMSGQAGGILNANTAGIIINMTNPMATDRVIIRNLVINGFNTGLAGIRLIGAASVTIEHVSIIGTGASSNPAIDLRPPTINGKIYLRDVEVHNALAAGIHIANASATLDNVFVSNASSSGLQVNDNAIVNVTNSRFIGSGAKGVFVFASTTASEVNLENTLVARSSFEGIFANQAMATVRLSNSSIFNNAVAVQANNSAMIFSFGNNRIAGNTSPGSAASMMPAMQQ